MTSVRCWHSHAHRFPCRCLFAAIIISSIVIIAISITTVIATAISTTTSNGTGTIAGVTRRRAVF
jgi:hypothetical protein